MVVSLSVQGLLFVGFKIYVGVSSLVLGWRSVVAWGIGSGLRGTAWQDCACAGLPGPNVLPAQIGTNGSTGLVRPA